MCLKKWVLVFLASTASFSSWSQDTESLTADQSFESGDYKTAANEYEKLATMHSSADYFYKAAKSWALEGQALRINTHYQYTYRLIIETFKTVMSQDSANHYYIKTVSQIPEFPDLEYDLAYELLQMQEYNLAVYHFLRSLSLDSTNSYAHGNLGWTYYLLGDYDKSIASSKKAITYNEWAYYAMFNHALAVLCKGDYNSAHQLYQEYFVRAKKSGANISGAIQDLKDLVSTSDHNDAAIDVLQGVFQLRMTDLKI
ncbi:MAG: hypothetical protein CMP48_24505 [Rickettsiales bacterium]|nr:hypothetical protein [Rickettsiales bacterium]